MDDLLGYRMLIGVIAPANNTVALADAARIRLTGVTAHQSDFLDASAAADGVPMSAIADAITRMDCKAPIASCVFVDDDFTAGAVDYALGGIARLLGRPDLVSPCEALVAAVAKFGSNPRIAVITPFGADEHHRALAALDRLGLQVVRDVNGAGGEGRATARTSYVTMRALYDRAVDGGGIDLVVQLGHNLPMARLVDNLEEDHSRPVLAINAVCVWHLLRSQGVFDPVPGAGTLLFDH